MFKQFGKDFAMEDLPDLINQRQKQKQSKKSSISGRGNIVPGAKAAELTDNKDKKQGFSRHYPSFSNIEPCKGGGEQIKPTNVCAKLYA